MNHFNHREVMAAAPDVISMALGVHVNHPHPFSRELTLREIAYAAGALVRPDLISRDERAVMGAGLATGDFSKVLAAAVQQVVVNTFSAQDEHSKFCAKVEAKNFHAFPLPSLDADLELEPLSENAEISMQTSIGSSGAVSAKLMTFAKILSLSRQAIYNDDMEAFSRVIGELGVSAARVEARLVAEALESNPTLDDGLPVFDSDLDRDTYNNLVPEDLTNSLIGSGSFGVAMGKLRTQLTASGARAGLAAKHLIVGPDIEHSAGALLVDQAPDIQIHVLSYLPGRRWYLLASPVVHPVVGTLRLKGSKFPVVAKEVRNRPSDCDGSAIKVIADLGAVLMSRTGLVRGGYF